MPNKPTQSQLDAIRAAGIEHRRSILDVDDAVRIACRRIRCRHTRAILQEAAAQNHQTASDLRAAILAAYPDLKPITDDELVALGGSGTKTGGGNGGRG